MCSTLILLPAVLGDFLWVRSLWHLLSSFLWQSPPMMTCFACHFISLLPHITAVCYRSASFSSRSTCASSSIFTFFLFHFVRVFHALKMLNFYFFHCVSSKVLKRKNRFFYSGKEKNEEAEKVGGRSRGTHFIC